MTTPTPSNSKLINAPYFKPIEGGYLFEICNPWIFGRGRSYIVTEEQKQALTGIISPPRMGLRAGLIIVALCAYGAGVGLLWWAISPRDNPSTLDLLGMALTILIPIYAILIVMVRHLLRRIEPIVSSASPTQARLTIAERYRAVGNAMSTKALIAGAVIFSASAITIAISILMRSNAQPLAAPIFQMVMSLSFFGFCAWTLYRRFRGTK